MAREPPELDADVIRRLHLRLDSDDDMVFEFESGERRFAFVVVLRDHKKLGWKECQALADCMKLSATGTRINNEVFCNCCEQLTQKYGAVRGPVAEHGRLVALVKPGPGSCRKRVEEELSHVAVSFDSDGDFQVQAFTHHNRQYDITLCLPVKATQCFSIVDCNAFIDVMRMLETGDPMDSVTFVSYLAVLRQKYNFIQYWRTGNHFRTNVMATHVKNNAPLDPVLVQALQAKQEEQNRDSSQAGTSGPLETCPYPKITYTRALQESGQAQVYAGAMEDGAKVAVKVFKGDMEEASETYRAELRILLKMTDHKNVIEVIDFFENPKPALITRLIEGEGDLLAYMKKYGRFEEAQGRQLATGIAEGICHLHKNGIIHRDLKTPNILVQRVSSVGPSGASASSDRLRPIIIDLGLGSTLTKKKKDTISMEELVASMAQSRISPLSAQTEGTKGTLLWMAPEMARDQVWSEKTDVFAFGIMMWEVFTGKLPYDGEPDINTGLDLLVKICNNGLRPDMSEVSHLNGALTKLMQECWDEDPERRPSMQRALDVLRGNDPVAIFRSIDTDNSKTLNFGELVQFLQQYAPGIKPAQMHSIFEAIDDDDSGDISFREFQKFWAVVERNSLEHALQLCQHVRTRQASAPCPMISHDIGGRLRQ